MPTMRERIIRDLTRSIVTGTPCALNHYAPPDPITDDERLQDAVINDTLKAFRDHKTPAFSGDSRFILQRKP